MRPADGPTTAESPQGMLLATHGLYSEFPNYSKNTLSYEIKMDWVSLRITAIAKPFEGQVVRFCPVLNPLCMLLALTASFCLKKNDYGAFLVSYLGAPAVL